MHFDPIFPLILVALGAVGLLWLRRESRKLDKRFGPDDRRPTPAE